MPGSAHVTDFGRYELQRLLGRGGMGEVYLARDGTLGREVALKFVAADRLAEAGARERLFREAQAAAALDHPCICTVYEAGEAPDGRAYIAMQYVEGETLAERLHRGPLPVREALTLASHIADALAAAHKRGIVHRDLKPGNVIITPSGRPKLLDFGLAKFAPLELGNEATTVTGLTQIGTVIGTPPYMAPEQVQQRPIDGRTDLFSLGAVLVECLTGKRVFEAPTSYETIANVLRLDPPPISTLRAELTEQHDELCARLLEKNPAERFQSAEEVLGALRVLLPDPSRTHTVPHPAPAPRRRWTLGIGTAAATSVVVLLAAWWLTQPAPLPSPPPAAQALYDKGTEALREGAYERARSNLEEAVRLFPQYALAYARLAEADTELDDERSAQTRLIRVADVAPDESRLPEDERLRVRAVRALVLRDDLQVAITAYTELTRRHPQDARSWMDLGRAQESAGLRADASASFQHAIDSDSQYAAAWLRLGTVEGAALHLEKALKAFGEAERLYQVAADVEGQTEVLLRRGMALDASDRLNEARRDLERALSLSAARAAVGQRVRAKLGLGSVVASEGQFEMAERLASEAVEEAVHEGLDTIAAEGLIDLGATLLDQTRLGDAETQITRAVTLAERRRATRTLARARLQFAELRRLQDRPAEALSIIDDARVLPFLRSKGFRRYELYALLIAARSQDALGHHEESRRIAADVLAVAESLRDDSRVALAASDLAARTAELGQYPQALPLRERAERIYRTQGNRTALPYALANHAELLIRLGRPAEADAPLDELETGIAQGIPSYVGRLTRGTYLRALAAAASLNCAKSLNALRDVRPGEPSDTDTIVAPSLYVFCQARLGRGIHGLGAPAAGAEAADVAERQYWVAAAYVRASQPKEALSAADLGLARLEGSSNDELRWRLSVCGLAAARRLRDRVVADRLDRIRRESESRLRETWGPAFTVYRQRQDLVDIATGAGLAPSTEE